MRRGVRVGVDVGRVRVGIARTDAEPLLAVPVITLQRGDGDEATGELIQSILNISEEYEAIELVVGLPLNMQGKATPSTEDAEHIAHALANATAVPVRLVDERLTTVSASAALRSSGINTRSQKPIIDQQAAVVLLQHAIDAEKLTESPPGQLVTPISP